MNDRQEGPSNEDDHRNKVEQHIKSVGETRQRLKEDLARAPRKDRPRRYVDSAINDAEFAIGDQLDGARESLSRMDSAETSTLAGRVDQAEIDGQEAVADSRDYADERWPAPMD